MASYRGVSKNQELSNNIDIRDTRSFGQKFAEKMRSKNFPIQFIIFLVAFSLLMPIYTEFLLIVAAIFYPIIKASQAKYVLPFKLPETANCLDWHQPKPGQRGTASMAQGVVFIGNEIGTNNELWLTDSDVRQHILLFGTTGAGKAFKMEEKFFTKKEGWKQNKHIKEGDEILTPFGFSKVVETFKQTPKKMMKVYFENGDVKEVSEDHLWEVYFNNDVLQHKYADFEEFRKNQHIHITETKHLKSFLKTKEIYIPLAKTAYIGKDENSDTTDYEYKLEKYSINDLAEILKTHIKNYSVSENNEALKIIKKLINNGTLRQKELLKEAFLEKLLSDNIYLNNVLLMNKKDEISINSIKNVEDKQVLKLFINSMEISDLVNKLFTYLGYRVVPQLDILGKHCLIIEKSYTLKIIKIEESTVQECQCIKIEDERGLLVLEGNIISHNTEALLSLLTNAFIQGSGFIFVDGKADVSTFAKMFSLARTFRREDDILLINYITSGQDVFGKQEKLMSNTLNPFISGSSSGLTELMVGLMDSGGGSDPMWQGRAIALVSAVMSGLVWMRDNEGLLLDIDVLREYLLLEKIAELAERDYGGVENIAKAIRAYLLSIPGYNPQKPIGQQESVVSEQHGYLQMQFTRILGSLSDTYGYIFRTNLGHVDFRDVVLNRRILLVLLPALEKSEPELQNLGKIVVSCIKSMMASTLGATVDTNMRDGVENRPTNALSAFYCVFDEYGYYIVKGSAVMPAQARSLGFCMLFAAQDLPSLQKNNNREEATSIIANCNLKIAMKVEDPGETFELFKKTAGEVLVEAQKSKERDMGSLSQSTYYDSVNISYEKRSKIEWLDFKEQFDGEAHMFHGSNMVRAKFFFVNPDVPSNLKFRPNYFIKVEPPKKEKIRELLIVKENLRKELSDQDYMDSLEAPHTSTLDSLFGFYKAIKDKYSEADQGIGLFTFGMLRVPSLDYSVASANRQFQNVNKQISGNAFVSPVGLMNSKVESHILGIDEDLFLKEGETSKAIMEIEEEWGDSKKITNEKTTKLLNQLVESANYPRPDLEPPEDKKGTDVSQLVKNLERMLSGDEDEF